MQTIIKNEKVCIYEKPSDFVSQKKFFSNDFLKDNTFPTAGVDTKKVKEMIKSVDFNYLSQQHRQNISWDFSRSKYQIEKYNGNPDSPFDKIRRYKISLPLYTKNRKMAFIYYEDICGFPECGSSNVKIFKKCKGKWKAYLSIPLSMS